MAKKRVTLSDGRVMTLEVPEGTTNDQIAKFIAAQTPKPKEAPKDERIDPTQDMTGAGKFVAGVGAGMTDAYYGLKQLGAEAGESLGLVSPEAVAEITRQGQENRDVAAPLFTKDTSVAPGSQQEVMGIASPQDRAEASRFTPGGIGNFVGKTAPFLAVPGGVAGGAPTRALTSAAAGGFMGAAEFVPEGRSRSANVALGAVGGAGMSGLLSAGGKVFNATAKNPTAGMAVQQQSEKFGIPTTLAELTGKPNKIDTIMEALPWKFGTAKFRQSQQEAAKAAATKQFSQYAVDPTAASTSAMKEANEAHIDTLYEAVRTSTATIPKGQAPETTKAAKELLDRYPAVFETIQDKKVKNILAGVESDTRPSLIVGGNQSPNTPAFSFDDLWTLRKGIGRAKGGAKTPEEAAQFSRLYAAVSDDMESLVAGKGGAYADFVAANDAFKKYSVKFDVMRDAYDKAIGTIGANTEGFFSPQRYAVELKRLANDPKYKKDIRWSGGEVEEMTGLANILQVTKRAGQFTENPPTGARWGALLSGNVTAGTAYAAGGLAATGKVAGVAGTAALVAKFLTTTPAGKRLALAASKVDPRSRTMQNIMTQVYKQAPKVTAQAGIESASPIQENQP